VTTPRELLDVITEYVHARADGADDTGLQDIVQRFDVVFTDALAERACAQPSTRSGARRLASSSAVAPCISSARTRPPATSNVPRSV
jgi:hypothetical protein